MANVSWRSTNTTAGNATTFCSAGGGTWPAVQALVTFLVKKSDQKTTEFLREGSYPLYTRDSKPLDPWGLDLGPVYRPDLGPVQGPTRDTLPFQDTATYCVVHDKI
jgi:hypothetical protein